MGQTYRTQKRKTPKKVPRNVPQLVNWSCTILLGIYQPTNRLVKKPPTGNMICPVMKSNQSKSDFP